VPDDLGRGQRAKPHLLCGGDEEVPCAEPDRVERPDTFLPDELQRQPEDLGRQRDIARGKCVCDATDDLQRRIAQLLPLFAQPIEGIAASHGQSDSASFSRTTRVVGF